ncbi:MAG: cytochrome P450 [Burkholderiaceae bacterium]
MPTLRATFPRSVAAARAGALRDLPEPSGRLPLLGHLARLEPARFHLQLEQWARELGMPYRLRFGPTDAVVLADVELYHRVMRERPHHFSRSATFLPVMREMGADGLFAAEGAEWHVQRRLVMQSLNVTRLRGYFPALRRVTERLYRRWHAAARRGEVLEMTDELMRFTVDVTSALAFGEDPNTIDRGEDRIQRHMASIFPTLMKRIVMPWPVWHWIRTPADRRFERDLAAVHAYAAEVIARARARLAAEPPADGAPRNALEAMLLARDAPASEFTDAMVTANVLTLLLAGEDTTANSVAWTLPYLAADAPLQARMHAEAIERLGDAALPRQYDDVRPLDAFEALATEATRLRPVVSFLVVDAIRDAELDGLALPAGTRLFFLMRPQATDPAHFADPMQFRPGRWSAPGACPGGAHEPRAHNQFGAGPRVCPGRPLAGVEVRMLLAMLLRNFTLELVCDPGAIREVCAFTVTPDRVPVRLRLRPDAVPPVPDDGDRAAHGAARREAGAASPGDGGCPLRAARQ